jgi:Na+/H+-dicarboxylate symporter
VPTIPAIGIVLVLSVDWFIGMARAAGNLAGNCVATVVVAAWEGDLDKARARPCWTATNRSQRSPRFQRRACRGHQRCLAI